MRPSVWQWVCGWEQIYVSHIRALAAYQLPLRESTDCHVSWALAEWHATGRKRSNIQSLIESRVSYNQGATGTSTIGWEKTGWYHPYSVESRQKSCMGRHGDRHSRTVVPDSISRSVGSSGCNS